MTPFLINPQIIGQTIPAPFPHSPNSEIVNLSALSLNDLLELPRENSPPLIDRVCYFKTPILITGQTGIGKSDVALALAFAVASGGLFLQEWPVAGAHRVLYIQSENTFRNLQDRIQRMPHDWSGRRIQAQGNIFILGNNGGLQLSGPLLNKNGGPNPIALKIKQKIEELKIEVAIFDPLSSYHGADENDNAQMRLVLDFILTFICNGSNVTPVIIHHHGKGNRERSGSYQSRGASAVSDWAGAHLSLTWAKGKKGLVKADWVKLRDFPRPDPITLRRGQDGRFQKVEENKSGAVPVQDVRVLLESMGGRSQSKEELVRQILKDLKVSRGTALKAIDDAEKKGLIHKAGSRKGKASPYSLTGDNKNE